MERNNFAVNIDKVYTDVSGNILDKNTAFPLGSPFRVKIPFYLWGRFDYNSQYAISRKITPVVSNAWNFFNMYIASSYEFLVFSGADQIRSRIDSGDIVIVYTDDVINPNVFCFIILSGQTNPYSAVLQDLDGTMKSLYFKYDSIQNPFNYQEELEYITTDKLGNLKRQTIQPDTFLPPTNRNTDVIDIDIEIVFSKYFSLNSYMLFETDNVSFTFLLASDRFDMNNKADFILNDGKFI